MDLQAARDDLERVAALTEEWRSDAPTAASPGEQHDLALRFAPALEELHLCRQDLAALARQSQALAGTVAQQAIECAGKLMLPLEEGGVKRELEDAARSTAVELEEGLGAGGFEVPNAVRLALEQASTSSEYCRAVRTALAAAGTLHVPAAWLAPRVEPRKDNTHQDRRDVERDTVVLEGATLAGNELKYEGVVDAVVRALERRLGWLEAPEEDVVDDVDGGEGANRGGRDPLVAAALRRFARAVVSCGNRTHSGGNAYEAVMKIFGGSELALVTPDSEQAEPVRIELALDVVLRPPAPDAEGQEGEEKRYARRTLALVASVAGTTKYLLKDPEDVERSLAGVRAEFRQTLAMPLPAPRFPCAFAEDDRCNAANRADYAVHEHEGVFAAGEIRISPWELAGQEQQAEVAADEVNLDTRAEGSGARAGDEEDDGFEVVSRDEAADEQQQQQQQQQ